MPLDYSKWKSIEISDDEDDTHPNIDTPSLFRWRHKARVERMEALTERKKNHDLEYERLQKAKAEISTEQNGAKATQLRQQYDKDWAAWTSEEEAMKIEQEKAPWNVDTISQEKFSRTLISKPDDKSEDDDDDDTDDGFAKRYAKFMEKHANEAKTFGMLRKTQDTERYLIDHPDLVSENAANFLVVWCIDLELEEKPDLMSHVARQAITLQFILELAKTIKLDPRACVRPFFAKLQSSDMDAMVGFTDELNSFKERIRKRAKEKLEQYMAEEEEKERLARLGPGGLDPVEVMESLPEELQKCFESKDVEMLKTVMSNLPKEQAHEYLDKCIKSGLWVPGKTDEETEGNEPKGDEPVDDAK